MSDNFQQMPNNGRPGCSPFAPPSLMRASLGRETASLNSPTPMKRAMSYSNDNSFSQPNWSRNVDPYMDSYSYIQSDGSIPDKGHNECVATSPAKNTTKKGKGTASNKRWQTSHIDLLLQVLCEEAATCGKPDKNFKRSSLVKAAGAVNDRFGENYTWENVHNRLRVEKIKWLDMLKAKDLSGAGWDDETKTILLDDATYNDLEKAKSKLCPYINKAIRNYELLMVVCGEDHATRSQAKTSYENYGGTEKEYVDLEALHEETLGDIRQRSKSSGHAPTKTSKSSQSSGCKRRREEVDDLMPNMVSSLTVIGDALEVGFMGAYIEKLGMKVWDVGDDVDDDVKTEAYDYLIDNRREGKRFVGFPIAQRLQWLQEFRAKRVPVTCEE